MRITFWMLRDWRLGNIEYVLLCSECFLSNLIDELVVHKTPDFKVDLHNYPLLYTHQVGYMAHAGGFFGGLFLGVLLLKNFRVYKFERVLFWMSLVFFILLVIVGIVINATSVNCGIGCQSDFTSLIDYSARLTKIYERP